MAIFGSHPSIDWMVAATAALALLAVVFASLIATRRNLADLRKSIEGLSEQVNELRRVEGMRYLKGLKSDLDDLHNLEVAPPLAPPSKSDYDARGADHAASGSFSSRRRVVRGSGSTGT
jgi:hypothetical protein